MFRRVCENHSLHEHEAREDGQKERTAVLRCLVTELVHRCGHLQVREDDRRSLGTPLRGNPAVLVGAGAGEGRLRGVRHGWAFWRARGY